MGTSKKPDTSNNRRFRLVVGKVYLHAVVDGIRLLRLGFLHVSKQPEAADAVVHNDVLPFYDRVGLKVDAILTDNVREFCGTDAHAFEFYLALAGIEHRKTRVRTPRTNGFVERFNGTVLGEFFRVKMRETFYASVEALQTDLDAWLVHYNTERPHLGYRNMGRRPWDTASKFVSRGAQEGTLVSQPDRPTGCFPRRAFSSGYRSLCCCPAETL